MRSFKRLLLALAVVMVAVLGLGVTAGADPTARPFKGTATGLVNFEPAPECPVGLKTVTDAQGTFSHLGRTTLHAEHCTPTGDIITDGTMTLVAANGDQLQIEYNGLSPFPVPPGTVIHITGDFRITGGTGRFADATGGRLDSDWATYNYTAELLFPGFDENGRPLPDWPGTWTFGPTTIGY